MTIEERIDMFTKMCNKTGLTLSDKFQNWLIENGFFTAPASTKYHGAYEGGLFDHSLAVTKRLIKLSVDNKIEWQRKESPFIVGMFHDLCKIDQYIKVDGARTELEDMVFEGEGLFHYEYNPKTLLKGHGSKSVMLLSQFMTLTEEEMLCIRYHMGAYEKIEYEWGDLDTAIKRQPNILFVHLADMLASKIDGI